MTEIGLGWGWGVAVQVRVRGLSASPGSQHGVVSHESHAPEKVRSSASAASFCCSATSLSVFISEVVVVVKFGGNLSRECSRQLLQNIL